MVSKVMTTTKNSELMRYIGRFLTNIRCPFFELLIIKVLLQVSIF